MARSLEGRGHRVFFDRDALPPGDSYEDRIEAAISKVSLFVFLISPDAIAPGRYTLTELAMAKARWRSAKGQVLPVMVRPTPIDDVPAYLRSVTILKPAGNLPAEIASAVQKMAWTSSRTLRRGALATLAASLVGLAVWYFTPPAPKFETTATPPSAHVAGFFGAPDVYNIVFTTRNSGAIADEVTDATLEVEPPTAVTKLAGNSREPEFVAPGSEYRGHFLVNIRDRSARFRVCTHAKAVRKACSSWSDLSPRGSFLYGNTLPIDQSLKTKATAVASDDTDFFVGATTPNRVVKLNERGQLVAELETDGIPAAISVGSLGLFVGLAGPDEIVKLDPNSLEILARRKIALSPARNQWDEPISTRPASLAQDEEHLWVLMKGGATTAGLVYFDSGLRKAITPDYYQDLAFDLSDMRLRSGQGAVWSGQDNTTPTSIYRLSSEQVVIYGGHDYDIASCASDVLPTSADTLLVPDCKGVVYRVLANETLDQREEVGRMLGYRPSANTWERVRLDQAAPNRVVATVNQRVSAPMESPERHEATVSKLNWPQGAAIVFDLDGAEVLGSAAGAKAMLLLLESDKGARELVSPGYD